MSSFALLLRCILALMCVYQVYGVRNVESEQICQKFLTRAKTSPLDPKNRRNFTRDENAEFECELVLQDETLPKQIRSTIHEGMSWLAVRHVQAGLRRHRDAVRHLESLMQLSPHHHNFAYRAGFRSLEPHVHNIPAAIHYLESAVHGRSSHAPIQYQAKNHPKQQTIDEKDRLYVHFTPEEDAYSARRFLINAYCGQDQYFAAMREVLSSLVEYPIDFGVLALYEQLKETILQNDPESTAVLLEEESTLQALKSTSSGGSGAGDDAVVSAKHAYDLILAHSSSAYPTPAPKVVRQDPAVPLTYNSFNSYVRSRTPVFIPSTPTIADTTVTAAAAAASDVALSTSSSETSADLLRFLDKLNDCGYLYANGDEHMELSVEISHRRGHTSASADTVATAATAGEDVVEHVGYGLSTLRTFVNYYDFLDQVYCAHYHGDHKPVSDGKPRANIMAGQHVIDTNKYNYYVTTQVRENVAAYYKLKNERYVGAYFDQQPVFMQYVIDAAKARKKFKDQLIYVDHLSVEEVAERMQAYQMEVDKKESERKSEYSHLYNVPLTSFLKDVEGVVPSILYQRNAVATANSTTVDVNVDGDSSGNIINRNENDIRNENASNSEDGDEEEHLYDIWGNMTDINLWMGVNGNINSNIIIINSSSSDSSIRAVTNTVTTKTRLHMDPHDNLYTLVTGRKKFMLIAPSYAPLLKTIYPTFAIGKNGMSFRTGGNIAIPWENKQQQENQESKQSDEFVSLVPPVLFSSDTASSHFSRLLPHQVESYCVEHNISFEIVELTQPGDRLFIPAGWFHQVTSYGDHHMALNYWWRPYGWKDNAKSYETAELGLLRDKLLNTLAVAE